MNYEGLVMNLLRTFNYTKKPESEKNTESGLS
jgi:hypothetical protein